MIIINKDNFCYPIILIQYSNFWPEIQICHYIVAQVSGEIYKKNDWNYGLIFRNALIKQVRFSWDFKTVAVNDSIQIYFGQTKYIHV